METIWNQINSINDTNQIEFCNQNKTNSFLNFTQKSDIFQHKTAKIVGNSNQTMADIHLEQI